MILDSSTVATIVGMAIVTYLTRIGGLALGGRFEFGPRAQAALDAIPSAVLIAVIAPAMLATGWRETVASVITGLAATRLPLLATIVIGVLAIVALRHLM
ncbi:AzlD family protein [Methylobacterium sp. M6A4_1b]